MPGAVTNRSYRVLVSDNAQKNGKLNAPDGRLYRPCLKIGLLYNIHIISQVWGTCQIFNLLRYQFNCRKATNIEVRHRNRVKELSFTLLRALCQLVVETCSLLPRTPFGYAWRALIAEVARIISLVITIATTPIA